MKPKHIILGVIFSSLLIGIGYVISELPRSEVSAGKYRSDIATCMSGYHPPGSGAQDLLKLSKILDLCYRIHHGDNMLSDFRLRRIKFVQQQYDEVVMLWMVVIVTISGVALAGLQRFASYHLALRQEKSLSLDSTELTVEQGRIILKSSITGLAILVVSFAFFLVFTLEIYTIREVDVDEGVSKVRPKIAEEGGRSSSSGYLEPSAGTVD